MKRVEHKVSIVFRRIQINKMKYFLLYYKYTYKERYKDVICF